MNGLVVVGHDSYSQTSGYERHAPGALRVFTRRQPFGWGRGGFYTGSSQWPSDRFAWRTLSEYGPSVRSVSTSENDPSAATAVVGM